MSENTVVPFAKPGEIEDILSQTLREGARALLAQAIELEVQAELAKHADKLLADGRQRVVRNGYGKERDIQTGIGPVSVQAPRLRDRGVTSDRDRIVFTSKLLPKYMRRTKSLDVLVPWLYLKGISTGDMQEALSGLLGDQAPNLSPPTVARLKQGWQEDYHVWQKRDLSDKHYVYIWADGLYIQGRKQDKQCVFVIIGATVDGKKELVALETGFREDSLSWKRILLDLKKRGLSQWPTLAIGDGGLGFWKALAEEFPTTRHQRCWVHKTANILCKLPKKLHSQAKKDLHEIYQAPTKEDASKAFDTFIATYEAKYPRAVACLEKDREPLLSFYDFPAEHWSHLRTTNPIESTFATVRHRTFKTKGCLSNEGALAMIFKLVQEAERRWLRLRGSILLDKVIRLVPFKDGLECLPDNLHNQAQQTANDQTIAA